MRVHAVRPIALLSVLLCGCGGGVTPAAPEPIPSAPAVPAPVFAKIDGVWIMDNPPDWSGPPMIWTLVQSGAEVTGTTVRTAPFVVRDSGTVTGTASENQFKLNLVHVIETANPSGCGRNSSTTPNEGVLNVTRAGDLMTGFIVRTDPRACGLRVFTGQQHTLRKQTMPLPPQPAPAPITVTVTYRPGPYVDYVRDSGCVHHNLPLHLSIFLSHATGGGASGSLVDAGGGVSQGTIAGAWPGEHRISVIDIGLCPPNGQPWSPWARSGVAVNGVPLTRTLQSSLLFSLSANGSVQP
jgi:hypothetical protein